MTRFLVSGVVALALAFHAAPAALAQEKPAMVPLKLDLVVSRQAGEKKVSSMPYTMWLTANASGRNESASLRMGVQVPVPASVSVPKEGAPVETVRSVQYRDIGTNIDVTAATAPDGRFGLGITVNDSGLNTAGSEPKGTEAPAPPIFRNFNSRFFLLLRDGQTAAYTSATDPLTGETLKIEVTLTVLK